MICHANHYGMGEVLISHKKISQLAKGVHMRKCLVHERSTELGIANIECENSN